MSFRINNFHFSVSKQCTSLYPLLYGTVRNGPQRDTLQAAAALSASSPTWTRVKGCRRVGGRVLPRGQRCPRDSAAPGKAAGKVAMEIRTSIQRKTLPLLPGLCLMFRNVKACVWGHRPSWRGPRLESALPNMAPQLKTLADLVNPGLESFFF